MKKPGTTLLLLACAMIATGVGPKTSAWAASGIDAISTISSSTQGDKSVLVLVNSGLYESIKPSLGQYVADLEAENYKVVVSTLEYTINTAGVPNVRPQDIKLYLQNLQASCANEQRPLKGAILVGSIPTVYLTVGSQTVGNYQVYPSDLYYMASPTTEPIPDPKYCQNPDPYFTPAGIPYMFYSALEDYPHYTLRLTMWIGRLDASKVQRPDMNEAAMVRNYFTKDHNYRIGTITIPQRAIFYDTWGDQTSTLADTMYPKCVKAVHGDMQSADYIKELTLGYEWMDIIVHSCPFFHIFERWVYGTEIPQWDNTTPPGPAVLFYMLQACHNARFTELDCMANHYIFSKQVSLAAIGFTKTAHVDNYIDLYSKLSHDSRLCLGDAFLYNFHSLPISVHEYTLLGDPTLSIDPPRAAITADPTNNSILIGKGSIGVGIITEYAWRSSKDGLLGSASTLDITKLTPGAQTIYLKVHDTKSRWSSEARLDITTAATPPLAPSDLMAETISNTKAGLHWHNNANNATGLILERRLSGQSGPFTQLAALPASAASYIDTTVSRDAVALHSYSYRIYAINAAGKSAYSAVGAITFPPYPPPAPAALATMPMPSNQVCLYILDNARNLSLGYTLERSTDKVSFSTLGNLPATTPTYTDTSLTAGTTYYYRLRSYNYGGYSAYTNIASGSPIMPTDTTPPSTPLVQSGVRFTANTATLSVNIYATDPESGIADYLYQVSQDSIYGAVIKSWTSTGKPNGTAVTLLSAGLPLVSGKTYYFAVRARNGAGLWGKSGFSPGITADFMPPEIKNLTPLTFKASQTPMIGAIISDTGSGVKSATVSYYFKPAGSDFYYQQPDLTMTHGTYDTYTVRIPSEIVAKKGIACYSITAYDNLGNKSVKQQIFLTIG